MTIWSAEIKELEKLYESFKGTYLDLEKELGHLIKTDDENVALLYSRRCLEVIITDLCECELKRPRGTEPLKGIIDKLNREGSVPSHIIASMHNLNSLSTFGAHPKDFDPEQVKPVLSNLAIIIRWYLKYKDTQSTDKGKPEEVEDEIKVPDDSTKQIQKQKKRLILLLSGLTLVIVIIVIALFVFDIIGGGKQTKELEKSIAVLPFDNLSSNEEQAWFSDGITDIIINQLSKISDLRVLGRTSTLKYKEKEEKKSIAEIGEELGVNFLIEGTVQRQGNQMRISVQLIRAINEDHLWSEIYDREYTDIFDIQSEIAQLIAGALKAAVSDQEKMIIEAAPTSDLQAYDYYLRGNDYHSRSYREEDFRYSIQMYEKAIEIDPDFTLAWVGLAASSRDLFWFYHDRSEENLSMAKNYLDKALALSPDVKEVQLEEARYYYHCKLDYPKALQVLEKLKTEYPNNDEIYAWIGYVYRRMGEFRKSLENSEYAISLNPSDWSYWSNAANTLRILREYTNAEKYYKRAINLNPSNSVLYDYLFSLYINTGQIKKAKEFIITNEKFIDSQDLILFQAQFEILARNYDRAVQITQSLSEEAISSQYDYYSKYRQLGLIYRAIPDNTLAIRNFKVERDILMKKINESENDDRLFRSLGIAYAGLGMKEEALKAGRKALEILDFSKDAHGGFNPEMDMVRILIMVGEYDKALTKLDQIIDQHGYITVEILKLDPFWEPVRDNKKFKEIISNPAYQISLSGD